MATFCTVLLTSWGIRGHVIVKNKYFVQRCSFLKEICLVTEKTNLQKELRKELRIELEGQNNERENEAYCTQIK